MITKIFQYLIIALMFTTFSGVVNHAEAGVIVAKNGKPIKKPAPKKAPPKKSPLAKAKATKKKVAKSKRKCPAWVKVRMSKWSYNEKNGMFDIHMTITNNSADKVVTRILDKTLEIHFKKGTVYGYHNRLKKYCHYDALASSGIRSYVQVDDVEIMPKQSRTFRFGVRIDKKDAAEVKKLSAKDRKVTLKHFDCQIRSYNL